MPWWKPRIRICLGAPFNFFFEGGNDVSRPVFQALKRGVIDAIERAREPMFGGPYDDVYFPKLVPTFERMLYTKI